LIFSRGQDWLSGKDNVAWHVRLDMRSSLSSLKLGMGKLMPRRGEGDGVRRAHSESSLIFGWNALLGARNRSRRAGARSQFGRETRENMAGKFVKFIILSVICIVQTHAFVRSKTAEEGARAAACMIDCTMS
jgi:hypothetical protein